MTNVQQLRLDEPEMLALCDASVLAHVRAFYFCDKRGTSAVMTSTELARCYVRPAQRRDLIEKGVWGEAEDGGAVIRGFAQLDTTGTEVQVGDNGESNGVVDHRKLASLRQARWRHSKRLQASTQPSTSASTGDSQSSTLASTETSTQPSTDCDIPPDPPQIHGLSGSTLNPESYSVLTSSPKDLTGSARVAKRRPRVIEKPAPLAPDFRPPQAAWEATLAKLECAEKDLERQLPDFRHYWIDGQGRGKERTPRGWVQAWMNRMSWLAERGQLHLTRSGIQPAEEHRRPYHEPFRREPSEPKASPKEALQAIQGALAGIGRRMPA